MRESKAPMKKWIWVVLFVVAAVGVVAVQGWQAAQRPIVSPPVVAQLEQSPIPQGLKPPQQAIAETVQAAKEIVSPIAAPQIDAAQVFNRVEALAFERATQGDRAQARNYISEKLKTFGWKSTQQPFEGGINLLAQRSGTDPAAGTILVGAHYDTVPGSPGADDNASGIAVVLEVARLLGPRRTPRGLQVVFFDGEERGLLGSLAFARQGNALKDVRGAIILDMVGFACHTAGCQQYPSGLPVTPPTDRGDFLAVVGDQEHLPLLNAFQQPERSNLPEILALPVPFKGLLSPDVLRSDHAVFWSKGVGAVLLTDTANLRTPHYHQPSDTPETIDRSFLAGAAQITVNATTVLLESQGSLETSPLVTPSPASRVPSR